MIATNPGEQFTQLKVGPPRREILDHPEHAELLQRLISREGAPQTLPREAAHAALGDLELGEHLVVLLADDMRG